jgi:hypothetical protein
VISYLKLFRIMLTIAGAAGCTSVPAVDRKDASQLFETRVNDKWTVSYRFPTDHAGFTPLPLKQVTSEGEVGVRIGGFTYPSGFLDRVTFSTLYSVSVRSYREPLKTNISAAEFVAVSSLEYKQKRTESIARGAMFVPEPPDFHIETFNNSWWVCNDVVRTGKGPGISDYTCRKPVVGDQVIDVTVIFAGTIEKRSEAYENARRKVLLIAASVSLKL